MMGRKRLNSGQSDSTLDNDSAFGGKRKMAASPFEAPRTEPPRATDRAGLDPQRGESSQKHVRALNSQFASWVQLQLQNHPDELWEDGVQDYLTHASHIKDKFSDVVAWLKANAEKAKTQTIPALGPRSTETKSIFGSHESRPTFGSSENKSTFGSGENKSTFGNSENKPIFASSENKPTFGNSENKLTFGSSENKPTFGNSENKPTFGNSENKPTFGSSENKPTFGSSENKPPLGNSENKPAFGNSENKSTFGSSENKSVLENSENKPTFGSSENKPTFGSSETMPTFGSSGYKPMFGSGDKNPIFGSSDNKSVFGSNDTKSVFGTTSNSIFSSNYKSIFGNNSSEKTFQVPDKSEAAQLSSTSGFTNSWSSGISQKSQTPVFLGGQNPAPVNCDASDTGNEEDELEKPSSPSVKKTEEKGIVVVHEVKCKLYVKSLDPTDKVTWKDKGMGQLSIKCREGVDKATKESKPTVVLRNDVGKVLLNALIYPGIKTNLLQHNAIIAIFHTSGDGNDSDTVMARTYLLKTKTEEDRNKLVSKIQEYAPAA